MDDAAAAPGRQPGQRRLQTARQLVEERQLLHLRARPLPGPAPHLALQVALGTPEVAEPHGVGIDRVQRGQRLHQHRPDGATPGLRLREARGQPLAHHDALDVLHHVEGRAVHLRLLAQGQRARHRQAGVPERRDHAVLAGHVVGGGEHVPERGAPQHEGARTRLHPVGEVRAAPADQREAQRHVAAGHPLREEARDGVGIDAGRRLGAVAGPGGVGRVGHAGSLGRARPPGERPGPPPRPLRRRPPAAAWACRTASPVRRGCRARPASRAPPGCPAPRR